MSTHVRDSIASDTSITTYASTFSSLKASTLGLTDSPHYPAMEMSGPYPTVQQPVPSNQPSPHRLAEQRQKSRPQLRTQSSSSSLDTSAQNIRARPRPVVKRSSNLATSINTRTTTPEQPASRGEDASFLTPSKVRSQSTSPRPPATARPSSTTDRPPSTSSRRDAPPTQVPQKEAVTSGTVARPRQPVARKPVPNNTDITRESPRVAMARSITQPDSNPSDTLRPPIQTRPRSAPRNKTPPSPSKSVDTMAEDWEAELARDAKRLQIGMESKRGNGKEMVTRQEQREKDKEWERSGMWDHQRDSAREAEERTRRDAGREIAYPPMQPRIPIRAAPSGVTSVHVGIRPRLHPSRESDSYISNQPDEELPQPLFSPLQTSHSVNLPGEKGVRGSYNTVYVHEMAEKAKGEYEAWKARKAEREGGVGDDDDGYGTRDWMPKSRMVAKPGAVEGIAHSEGYNDHRLKPDDYVRPETIETPVQTPHETSVWSQYGCPQYQGQMPFQGGENWGHMYPSQMNSQGMWDPSMWWNMQGMQQEQGDQFVQSTDEQSRKVHFAESPEKLKHKSSLQDFPHVEQYGLEQQDP